MLTARHGYWRKTRRLAAIGAAAACALLMAAPLAIRLGLDAGMAGLGGPAVLMVAGPALFAPLLIWLHAAAQHGLDRGHGVAEDD